MSEELQQLQQLGLSLILCNGQWYCGRFGGDYDGDEGYIGDKYNRCVDGVLRDDGVADTISEAIALAVAAHKMSKSNVMYFQASDYDPATKTWPQRRIMTPEEYLTATEESKLNQ